MSCATQGDYIAAAARHRITMAAIKAVAQVESGGRSGFDDQFRAKILFEAHHFRKYTVKRFDLSHPHLSCNRQAGKKYYVWNQYSVIEDTAWAAQCDRALCPTAFL